MCHRVAKYASRGDVQRTRHECQSLQVGNDDVCGGVERALTHADDRRRACRVPGGHSRRAVLEHERLGGPEGAGASARKASGAGLPRETSAPVMSVDGAGIPAAHMRARARSAEADVTTAQRDGWSPRSSRPAPGHSWTVTASASSSSSIRRLQLRRGIGPGTGQPCPPERRPWITASTASASNSAAQRDQARSALRADDTSTPSISKRSPRAGMRMSAGTLARFVVSTPGIAIPAHGVDIGRDGVMRREARAPPPARIAGHASPRGALPRTRRGAKTRRGRARRRGTRRAQALPSLVVGHGNDHAVVARPPKQSDVDAVVEAAVRFAEAVGHELVPCHRRGHR